MIGMIAASGCARAASGWSRRAPSSVKESRMIDMIDMMILIAGMRAQSDSQMVHRVPL